jgi:hypothetical protein
MRNDTVLCVFLLAACLAYNCYTLIVYLQSFDHGLFDFAWRPVGRDFINYWTAAVAVSEGMIPLIFDVDLFHLYQEGLIGAEFSDHSWSYPPHMLLLVWPFGHLPYLWALAAWSFLILGLYLWAATWRHEDSSLLLLALLLAPATIANFVGGQNGFLTGALLIGGFRLLGTRPLLAGILFGILTVKPQLGILLPFALLAARQWTAIVSASATTAVLVGASVLAFGWESWEAYIKVVIPHQTEVMNERPGGFLAMMPSAYMGLRLLDAGPIVRNAVQAVFAVIALGGVVWAFARSRDAGLCFTTLVIGTFLASPYGFNYDMTTVSLAVTLIALRGLRCGFLAGERVVLAATWLLPVAILWLNDKQLPVGSLVLLACFVYVLLRVRQAVTAQERGTIAVAGSREALAS